MAGDRRLRAHRRAPQGRARRRRRRRRRARQGRAAAALGAGAPRRARAALRPAQLRRPGRRRSPAGSSASSRSRRGRTRSVARVRAGADRARRRRPRARPRRRAPRPPRRRACGLPGRRPQPGCCCTKRSPSTERKQARLSTSPCRRGPRACGRSRQARSTRRSDRVSRGAASCATATAVSTTANISSGTSVGTATSTSAAPRSMMRRLAIWYQRSGSSPPTCRTPSGISWYGVITPDSTNDGRMKKTDRNTACADVRRERRHERADAERRQHEGQRDDQERDPAPLRPVAEQQARGHERDEHLHVAERRRRAASFPSTIATALVGSASICS